MRIAIRVDASLAVGSGHQARMLTLAETLTQAGHEVVFMARSLDGDGLDHVRTRFAVCIIDADAPQMPFEQEWPAEAQRRDALACKSVLGGFVDWVIADHYGLGRPWEACARGFATGVMVIDDLANRSHDCDVLLDQNRPDAASSLYRPLVGEDCELLLGPSWALLRPEFDQARAKADVRRHGIRRVLVFMGGSDAEDRTSEALEALRIADLPGVHVDVVLGRANPNAHRVRAAVAALPDASVSIGVNDMADRMARADLAIGAAGTATWERCFVGLPAVMFVAADNQRPLADAVEEAGAGWRAQGESPGSIAALLGRIADKPSMLSTASEAAFQLAGREVTATREVARLLVSRWLVGRPHARLRALRKSDLDRLREWRNSDRVRATMVNQDPIAGDEHRDWFERHLDRTPATHMVFEVNGRAVGMGSVSEDERGPGHYQWGFYLGETDLQPGTGSRLCWLLLDYAFGQLNAKAVIGRVRRENAASLAIHSKLGFTHDASSDDREMLGFSLAHDEWADVRERTAGVIFGLGDSECDQIGAAGV